MVNCERCGKELTDPVSIARGFGPECLNREDPYEKITRLLSGISKKEEIKGNAVPFYGRTYGFFIIYKDGNRITDRLYFNYHKKRSNSIKPDSISVSIEDFILNKNFNITVYDNKNVKCEVNGEIIESIDKIEEIFTIYVLEFFSKQGKKISSGEYILNKK
jgi:hypothetical protein